MIPEHELDRRLSSLPIDWPPGNDVVPAVAARLNPSRRRPFVAFAPRLAALAVVLLAIVVMLVSPGTRAAVARLLGFPGVTVERSTQPLPELSGIDLGEQMTVEEAEARAGFDVRTLPLPDGRPFFDPGTGAVHVVYPRDAGGPVLLSQLTGDKDIGFHKRAGNVAPAEVNGDFALWITGRSHVLLRAVGRGPEARLSDNSLLWASDDVTYRLELDGSVYDAVNLAERLR